MCVCLGVRHCVCVCVCVPVFLFVGCIILEGRLHTASRHETIFSVLVKERVRLFTHLCLILAISVFSALPYRKLLPTIPFILEKKCTLTDPMFRVNMGPPNVPGRAPICAHCVSSSSAWNKSGSQSWTNSQKQTRPGPKRPTCMLQQHVR